VNQTKLSHLAIIGAGVSGLSAAFHLKKLLPACQITIFESAARAGGLIATEHAGHNTILEHGPDAILANQHGFRQLLSELGLEREIIAPNARYRGAYVVHNGELQRIPQGFRMLAPTKIAPFLTSDVLSRRARLRALIEPWIARTTPHDSAEDQSIESFVVQRFGREMLESLVEPMIRGVYGGDPKRLSLRSTLPDIWSLRQQNKSVLRAFNQAQHASDGGGARYGLFVSFKAGMQTLVDALLSAVRAEIHYNTTVESVIRAHGQWQLSTHQGADFSVDGLVVALPAFRAAQLLQNQDPELAATLGSIAYGSLSALTYVVSRSQVEHPLDGFGFVVPSSERLDVVASTWSSVKFEGRAPSGLEIIRTFTESPSAHLGEQGYADVLEQAIRPALSQLIKLQGTPLITRVHRYERAMPRYELGHHARVTRIFDRARTLPGFALAGNAYFGVGIPAAIETGRRAALNLTGQLTDVSELS